MIEKTLLSSYVKDFVNWDTQISDTLAKFKSSIDLSRWIMSFLAYYDWSIHKWISEKDYQYIQALEFSWRVIFPEYKLIIEKNYQELQNDWEKIDKWFKPKKRKFKNKSLDNGTHFFR